MFFFFLFFFPPILVLLLYVYGYFQKENEVFLNATPNILLITFGISLLPLMNWIHVIGICFEAAPESRGWFPVINRFRSRVGDFLNSPLRRKN